MGWLRMEIRKGQDSGNLEMDQLKDEGMTDVIRGFFGVFGAEPEPKRPEFITSLNSPAFTETFADPKFQVTENAPSERKKANPKLLEETISKVERLTIQKPELINSARTLSISLGEKITQALGESKVKEPTREVEAAETGQPEHYKTGIKYKEGVPHYRCRYYCKNPRCGIRSQHYIRKDIVSIRCHGCGTGLTVREAVPGKPLERDEWGNFFIADKLADAFPKPQERTTV